MELSQLKYFYTAAKYEHITRAAEELHVAQPALTQSIHRLEDELGVKLFERSGRRIVLNKYGRYLRDRISPVFDTVGSVPEELRNLREKELQTVRLNVLEASAVVAGAIIAYHAEHKNVDFKLTQSMSDTNCDISVNTAVTAEHSDDHNRAVFREQIFLAVPRTSEYANLASVTLSDLADEHFVFLSDTQPFRDTCNSLCASAGFTPKVSFECENPVMAMHLIGAGLGIGFYAQFSWSEAKHSDIKLIPISSPNISRSIVITRHTGSSNLRASNDFYSFIVDYFRKKQAETV